MLGMMIGYEFRSLTLDFLVPSDQHNNLAGFDTQLSPSIDHKYSKLQLNFAQ